jgi:hypothetical protein
MQLGLYHYPPPGIPALARWRLPDGSGIRRAVSSGSMPKGHDFRRDCLEPWWAGEFPRYSRMHTTWLPRWGTLCKFCYSRASRLDPVARTFLPGSAPKSRNSLSLARSDCSPSRTTAARSTLPAYFFDEILNSSSDPFGPELPILSPRSSRAWGCSSLKARCRLASPEFSNVHPTHTPLREVASLRDQSARLAVHLRSLPSCPAR